MSVSERENIHTLFLGKNYLELYKTQSKVLQAMLFVETQKEFGYCTGVCSWNAFSGFAIFKPLCYGARIRAFKHRLIKRQG